MTRSRRDSDQVRKDCDLVYKHLIHKNRAEAYVNMIRNFTNVIIRLDLDPTNDFRLTQLQGSWYEQYWEAKDKR